MNTPCQSGDPDRFFPANGAPPHEIKAVKDECAPCPILEQCRDWAVRHDEPGIWGGTTGYERRLLRREQNITATHVRMAVVAQDHTAAVRSMVARGFSAPEIAAALGISKSGAGQAVARVKKQSA